MLIAFSVLSVIHVDEANGQNIGGTINNTTTDSNGTIVLYEGFGPQPRNVALPDSVTNPVCGADGHVGQGAGGAKANPGLEPSTPIDRFGICRFVNVSSAAPVPNGYFAPFNTATEWAAFYNKAQQNTCESITLEHCARPFEGQNICQGLYIGPTSALPSDFNVDGSPASLTYNVHLPYWRADNSWPPTDQTTCLTDHPVMHQFNYYCTYPTVVPVCWQWGTCSGSCGPNCSFSYACCTDSGSVCSSNTQYWSEDYDFAALATDSDASDPSWTSGCSHQVGGVLRPDICWTTSSFNGHDCTINPPPCTNCASTGGHGVCVNPSPPPTPACCDYWHCAS